MKLKFIGLGHGCQIGRDCYQNFWRLPMSAVSRSVLSERRSNKAFGPRQSGADGAYFGIWATLIGQLTG